MQHAGALQRAVAKPSTEPSHILSGVPFRGTSGSSIRDRNPRTRIPRRSAKLENPCFCRLLCRWQKESLGPRRWRHLLATWSRKRQCFAFSWQLGWSSSSVVSGRKMVMLVLSSMFQRCNRKIELRCGVPCALPSIVVCNKTEPCRSRHKL